MADNQKEPLSIAEQSIISKAVLELVNCFPDMPKGVKVEYQYISDSAPIAVFSMQGAVKMEEYLGFPGEEKFDGQFPFFMLFRCKPTSTQQRIQKQNFLDKLGEWLEKQEYPSMTGNRTITEIKRTSTTFLSGREENGTEEYQCNFNLIYEKR